MKNKNILLSFLLLSVSSFSFAVDNNSKKDKR